MLVRLASWLSVLSGAAAVAYAGWLWSLPQSGLVPLSRSHDGAVVLVWGGLSVGWAAVGAGLTTLSTRSPLGPVLLAIGLSQAWHIGMVAYAIHGLDTAGPDDVAALWVGYAGSFLFGLGALATPTLLLALYPDGRLATARSRVSAAVAGLAVVHLATGALFQVLGDASVGPVVVIVPDFLQGVPTGLLPPSSRSSQPVWTTDESLPTWATALRDGYLSPSAPTWVTIYVAAMLAIWVETVLRLVRARSPQRQQLAWLVCVVMPCLAGAWLAPSAARLLVLVTLLLVPAAVAIGVLRYQLLGIEAVLRRGPVYGVLTAAIFGLYWLSTALVGTTLASNPTAAVLTAALLAIGLVPVRDQLQRCVDRLVYGEQHDPLRAITRLGQRLASTRPLELLPAALTTVTEAVRAPGAAVLAPDGRTVGRVGASTATAISVPLSFGGDPVGELRVALPPAGDRYPGRAYRLLSAMAAQVAVVVRALQLTEALQTERDRVVAATRWERDRLRRDLHDGLGPSLSGVGLGLQALADRQDGRDASTRDLVERLRAEVATAVGEVRRIIDNLRPVVLDTLGLAGAVRQHTRTVDGLLPVLVEVDVLPPLSVEVETAAYRIAAEALTNAARHAGASRVRVTLVAAEGALLVTVADDGCGVGDDAVAGIGLSSMCRRAESLGGRLDLTSGDAGTIVTATLPLERP